MNPTPLACSGNIAGEIKWSVETLETLDASHRLVGDHLNYSACSLNFAMIEEVELLFDTTRYEQAATCNGRFNRIILRYLRVLARD
jgi:hypothetical protein